MRVEKLKTPTLGEVDAVVHGPWAAVLRADGQGHVCHVPTDRGISEVKGPHAFCIRAAEVMAERLPWATDAIPSDAAAQWAAVRFDVLREARAALPKRALRPFFVQWERTETTHAIVWAESEESARAAADAERVHISDNWMTDHDGWQVEEFSAAIRSVVTADDCVVLNGRIRNLADASFVVEPAGGAA